MDRPEGRDKLVLHRHTRLTGALAIGALVLGTSTLAATTQGAASAAPGDSPLTIWTPDKIVEYSYGGRVYSDIGVKVIAPEDAFEVRSVRPTYDDPIETTWTSGSLSGSLPEGSVPNWNTGLKHFTKLIVRDLDGKVIKRTNQDACFGGYSQRVRPDAPTDSPYPYYCPWNPYTLGSVMGVQAGHAASVSGGDEYYYGRPLRLEPGRYDVTAMISPAYADAIGISDEDSVKTMRLVVKKGDDEFRQQHPSQQQSTTLQPAAHAPANPTVEPPADTPAPDLRSLPAWGMTLNSKGTTLRFAATVWNGGTSPLVVDGFRSEDHDAHMDAYQYFYDEEGEQVGEPMAVGEMHWHAQNHQHWHFEDFARYRLLNADQTEAVKSTKQSFCLANTDAVDYTLPGSDWQPENTDLSSACGGFDALSVREVLSAGSGDTYMQYRYGQAFRIKNLPDGVYWVSVEANPFGQLAELDETNNVSLRKIKLVTNNKGVRQVKVPQIGIIDEGSFGF